MEKTKLARLDVSVCLQYTNRDALVETLEKDYLYVIGVGKEGLSLHLDRRHRYPDADVSRFKLDTRVDRITSSNNPWRDLLNNNRVLSALLWVLDEFWNVIDVNLIFDDYDLRGEDVTDECTANCSDEIKEYIEWCLGGDYYPPSNKLRVPDDFEDWPTDFPVERIDSLMGTNKEILIWFLRNERKMKKKDRDVLDLTMRQKLNLWFLYVLSVADPKKIIERTNYYYAGLAFSIHDNKFRRIIPAEDEDYSLEILTRWKEEAKVYIDQLCKDLRETAHIWNIS